MSSRLVLLLFTLTLLGNVGLPPASAQDLNFEIPDETQNRPLPSASWLWVILPGLVGWACWAQSRRDTAVSEVRAISWHNAKLQEMANDRDELTDALANVRTRLADQEAESRTVQQQLLSRLKDAEARVASEKAVNVALQEDADNQLMARSETQRAEIRRLQEELETLRADNDRLRITVDTQRTQWPRLESENRAFAAKIEDQQKRLSELEENLTLARHQQQNSDSAYAQLQAQATSVGTQLDESQSKVARLKKALSQCEDQVASLQKALESQSAANVDLEHALDQARNRLSQSQTSCRENAERLQASYGELSSLKQQLNIASAQQHSESEHLALASKIATLTNQIAEWTRKPTAPSRPSATEIRSRFDKSRRPGLRVRDEPNTLPQTDLKVTSLKTTRPQKATPKPSRTAQSTSKPARMRTAAKVRRKTTEKKTARRVSRTGNSGSSASDRLTRIKGIGPQTAALLQAAGITSFRDLVAARQSKLRAILDRGGSPFQRLDSSKWPTLAANELREKKRKPRPKRR